jgi:hypothetical protein
LGMQVDAKASVAAERDAEGLATLVRQTHEEGGPGGARAADAGEVIPSGDAWKPCGVGRRKRAVSVDDAARSVAVRASSVAAE